MLNKKVLLKDIAERLGLTVNTVSRSLKDKDDISEKTKQLVKDTAYEMGYIPNVVASSLRSGFTKTIGVMFDNISNPYYMIMTEMIHNQIKEMGYDLMVFTNSGDHSRFNLESFNKMISRRIDGIITFLKPTQEVAKIAKINHIPLVIIGRDGKTIGIDSVDTDDFQGGYLAGKHLIEKGHTQIGYIGVPKEIECSENRYKGLVKALEEAQIPQNPKFCIYMKHGENSVKHYVEDLVQNKVTAIFCFNDNLAFEIIDYIHEMGLAVPTDIAIIGYDNIQNELKLPIKLTTISCHKEQVTKGIVKILMNKILKNQETMIRNETYDIFLVERATT